MPGLLRLPQHDKNFTPSQKNRVDNQGLVDGIIGTSYSDSSGLAASTTYYYLVQAIDASGTSAMSNLVQVTTPLCDPGFCLSQSLQGW